jgi:hypothetical protein
MFIAVSALQQVVRDGWVADVHFQIITSINHWIAKQITLREQSYTQVHTILAAGEPLATGAPCDYRLCTCGRGPLQAMHSRPGPPATAGYALAAEAPCYCRLCTRGRGPLLLQAMHSLPGLPATAGYALAAGAPCYCSLCTRGRGPLLLQAAHGGYGRPCSLWGAYGISLSVSQYQTFPSVMPIWWSNALHDNF